MNGLRLLSDALVELVATASPAVVGVEHERGQGSGTVLSSDGLVLTNAHVVRGARELRVRTAEDRVAPARLVGADGPTDLAVLQAELGPTPHLRLADDRRLRVGQVVVAIGNPLRFDRSVSLGVVSALDRALPAGRRGDRLDGLIQTDAAINPGNSGGPLVDADGAVVGVCTAIVPWAQGIGFAVPATTAGWVAARLIAEGSVTRPRLGVRARSESVSGLPVDDPLVDGEPGAVRALRVHAVDQDTPAARAGLRSGDVVLAVDGARVRSIDDLQRRLVHAAGRAVPVAVLRGQERHLLWVTAPARAA